MALGITAFAEAPFASAAGVDVTITLTALSTLNVSQGATTQAVTATPATNVITSTTGTVTTPVILSTNIMNSSVGTPTVEVIATPATNVVTTYMGVYAVTTDYDAEITAGAEIDLDMTIGDVTVEANSNVVASTNVITSTAENVVAEVIALPSGQDLTLTQGEEVVTADANATATTNVITSSTGTLSASATATTIQTTNLISSTLGDVSLVIDVVQPYQQI